MRAASNHCSAVAYPASCGHDRSVVQDVLFFEARVDEFAATGGTGDRPSEPVSRQSCSHSDEDADNVPIGKPRCTEAADT